MRVHIKKLIGTGLVLAAGLIAGAAHADAKGEIEYRQGVMKVVGGQMSSMVAVMRNGVRQENFARHANAMAEIAKVVPSVFPAGSGDGKTEALPAIWTDAEGFRKAIDAFTSGAEGLAAVAASGDPAQIGPAFRKLGASCKGCHDDFREDHDH